MCQYDSNNHIAKVVGVWKNRNTGTTRNSFIFIDCAPMQASDTKTIVLHAVYMHTSSLQTQYTYQSTIDISRATHVEYLRIHRIENHIKSYHMSYLTHAQ